MRKYTPVFLLLLTAFELKAQTFINGQAARAVIGQYTFTYGGAIPGVFPTRPGQQILGGVSGLAWANNILYVADSNRLGALPQDHRVVMFNTGLIPDAKADLTNSKSYSSYSCNVCGYPATNALGQPSFDPPALPANIDPATAKATTFTPGTDNMSSVGNMQQPTAVASDGAIVAVADTDNNRVLLWKSIPITLNQPADIVLGQSTFLAHATPSVPTASSLSGPQGVWISNGKLFVADTQNFRILIWNTIPASNNQPADLVLGQTNFNTGTQAACNATTTATSPLTAAANFLCNPTSVTSDGVHLFVADLAFNRVLIWNSIPSSNGQNADVVVGQPTMAAAVGNNSAVCPSGTGTQGQCAATLNYPRFALSDGRRLFIADGGNDRVLIFNSIPTSNGVAADEVLGEPDFLTDLAITQTIGVASTTIDNTSGVDVTPTPTSLAFDGTNLYVSDPSNNRVLVFTPGNSPLPNNSVVNWASETIRQEGTVTFTGTIVANDTVTVTIAGKAYTYTIVKTDTLDTVAQGIVTAINADSGDPNATAIFAGSGSGSLYLSSKGLDLGFKTITLAATTSSSTDIAAVTSGDYLSSGTAATASPGMLVEINGTNLSDLPATNPAIAAMSGTIPTILGGTQVFMDGVASPIFRASASQVISQVPFNFTDRNSTSIVVRTTHNDGSVTVTNATPVYIAGANPGLFGAPATAGQQRPWPATGAYHQPGNPQAAVDVEGTITAGNTATITVNGVGHTYTVASGDTLDTVVTGLINVINSAPDPLVTASAGNAFHRVIITARQGGAAGNGISIATSVSSGAAVSLFAYNSATCCDVVPGLPITSTNPAAPNETITISGAGLGQIADLSNNVIGVVTGQPYSGPVQNSVLNNGAVNNFVSASLGATSAQVLSAGLPQGSYGIYQVQLIVPSSQPTSDVTQVTISQNAYVSNIVTIPVGPANSNPNQPPASSGPIQISIDAPAASGAAVSGSTPVVGWVADTSAPITNVTVSVDGIAAGTAYYGIARPDVCAAIGGVQGCPNVGYYYSLDTTGLYDGTHTIQITATDSNGTRFTSAGSFITSNYLGSNPVNIGIDSPNSPNAPYVGLSTFFGWAVNDGGPVNTVAISIDGVFRGNAVYGDARPDVCQTYTGRAGCPNVGWHFLFDTATLTNGTHIFSVSAVGPSQRAIQSHNFTVANWTTSNPIIINFERPTIQDSAFSGTAAFGGWAVDLYSQIAYMTASIDGIPYGGVAYGGGRSDVCAVFSTSPGCPNVGWNLLVDTTLLGDGTHTLELTAYPISGQGFTASKTFAVANMGLVSNPTSISIDSPGPSSPAFSNTALFGGWALNANESVQSVEIFVDGVSRGFAAYGGPRSDVCAILASPACPNVGWNYLFDTSVLTNGTHLLQVTVTTVSGLRASAGSSFSVQNQTGTGPTSVTITQPTSQNVPYQGLAVFSGIAANSNGAAITSISVTVDGFPYGLTSPSSGTAGTSVYWSYILNTSQLADGTHTLGISAVASDGTTALVSSTFAVANWTSPSPIIISIDAPNAASPNLSGTATFGGWAIYEFSSIANIQLAIDGVPYGMAAYGGDRSDVCAVYTNFPGCPNVGWNIPVDTRFLSNGTHTVAVTATTGSGQSYTASSGFVVAN